MVVDSFVQAAGMVSSLCVSGIIFTFSLGGVSTAQLAATTSPVLSAKLWLNVYKRCHTIGTPMVVFSAACFGWLKYKTNNNVYLAAATSCLSIVPYTIVLLSGPEKILFATASQIQKPTSASACEDARQALHRWGAVNMLRAMFPLVGGILVLGYHML
ncbi:hypothetical protein BDV29DRAFT_196037 [Aspergillus leporis]|uniref:DUF1772-domain-containing protein n=1 Tax=Aspergillus leporis TaxID=41062 RepID=A0A5N5WHN0_9EURO|nr:hypothetical protein BDV29DRAFT_196037 [Aspergillus leporis]